MSSRKGIIFCVFTYNCYRYFIISEVFAIMDNTGMIPEYFAAANGYTGFRSYFDEIFDSESFERIFIIKGGPGTGKSSYMKRIASSMREFYNIEVILCSSDPKSYDGMIISKNDRKFAVVDGTAPHVRDAENPGAIDEIINLGDNWDDRWLVGKKAEILALSNEKKKAYSVAYNFLNLAGETTQYRKRLICKNQSVRFKKQAKSVADSFKSDKGTTNIRLVSAFGKSGFVSLPTIENQAKQIMGIVGERDAAGMFLKLIHDELNGFADFTVFPDVLDAGAVEALFIHNTGTLIRREKSDGIVLPETCVDPTDIDISLTLTRMHTDLLNEAQRWFGIAADLHFRLENIYGAAMDYSKNDKICELTIEKIASAVERC